MNDQDALDGATDDTLDEQFEGDEATDDATPRRASRQRERAADQGNRIAKEQLGQAQKMAAEMRHKRGCPESSGSPLPGEEDSRIEFAAQKKPNSEDLPPEERGERVIEIRCLECGEAEIERDESEIS